MSVTILVERFVLKHGNYIAVHSLRRFRGNRACVFRFFYRNPRLPICTTCRRAWKQQRLCESKFMHDERTNELRVTGLVCKLQAEHFKNKS